MIAFKPLSLTERIKRLWPAYRKRRDDEMKEAIRRLIADPSLPCMIGEQVVPNGYGMPGTNPDIIDRLGTPLL